MEIFFLFSVMGSDAGNCIFGSYSWGHEVCLVYQLNIMEQTTSEICFCK